jgi:hypothetical protein
MIVFLYFAKYRSPALFSKPDFRTCTYATPILYYILPFIFHTPAAFVPHCAEFVSVRSYGYDPFFAMLSIGNLHKKCGKSPAQGSGMPGAAAERGFYFDRTKTL